MSSKRYIRIFLALASIYGLLCAGLSVSQRYLVYHPAKRDVAIDVNLVLDASTITLVTADNERVMAWFVPPRDSSYPLYLYLPGNAETLANRAGRFALLTEEGAGLLAVSWRGYGGSSGAPSEAGLLLDAEAAYEFAVTRVKPGQVILFGESLGSAVAVQLAALKPNGALALDAAYPSLVKVFRSKAPVFPYSLLLRDTFEAEDLAPRITVPVLQRHCTDDGVLPYPLARELFEAFATNNKQWFSVEGSCHLPPLDPWLPDLRRLEQLLRRVVA